MSRARSEEATAARQASAAEEGPIRDLGYHRYEGRRLPHRSRYGVLARRHLSMAWSSGLVKTVAILGMFPMVVCGVILFFKIKAQQLLAAQGVPLQMDDPGQWVFYCVFWCQIWFAFPMSLLLAAPAISEDVRTGAFQFYFARPVTRSHYLVGKLVPVAVLLLLLTVVPGLLLAILRLALAGNGAEVVAGLKLVGATVLYAPLIAATLALPPLALSSLTRRTGSVQGLWAALFFLPWILGEGVAAATDFPHAALISLPTNLRLLGQHLYGMGGGYAVAWSYSAAVVLGLLVASAIIVIRRLDRVEVFT